MHYNTICCCLNLYIFIYHYCTYYMQEYFNYYLPGGGGVSPEKKI